MFISLLVIIGLGCFILTGIFRQYALLKNVIDKPNDRSSHQVPTPRGGGVAIVIAFAAGVLSLHFMDYLAINAIVGMLGAGIIVALLGSFDDHIEISAKLRLVGHFVAAIWFFYWLERIPFEMDSGTHGYYNFIIYCLIVLYLVWLINLYNFMDGINGIASVEAITVSFSSAILLYLADPAGSIWMVTVVLAIAVLGFLFWNFPHAKIFMGDAGSGFLGLTFGAISIYSIGQTPGLAWSWLILLGIFFVDATLTLVVRYIRKDIWYRAHRDHAYQHAALRWGHKKTTLTVMIINIVWLFPLAYFASVHPEFGAVIFTFAYAPLIYTAIIYRAGRCNDKSI